MLMRMKASSLSRQIPRRLARALVMLAFGMGMQHYLIVRFGLPAHLMSYRGAPVTTAITWLILAAAVHAFLAPLPARRQPPAGRTYLVPALAVIASALSLPSIFLLRSFGMDDLDTVATSVMSNDLGSMVSIGLQDFAGLITEEAVIFGVVLLSAMALLRSLPGFRIPLVALLVAAIAISSPARYLLATTFPDPAGDLVSVDDLTPPVIVGTPARKPNIVLIYLESLERTYRDIPATAEAFAPIAALEDAGFSARNVS